MTKQQTSKPIILMAVILLLAGGYFWYKSNSGIYSNEGQISTSTPLSTTTPVGNTPGGHSNVLPYGQVKLHLNEVAKFNNFTLTPTKIVEDSRCPKGVYCIQAGTVRVELSLSTGMGMSTPIIQLGKFINTEAEKITLVLVDPIKTTGLNSPADYIFTFDVEKLALTPVATGGCYVGGCSGQVCSDVQGVISTCEYRAEYACYKTAKCERQTTGQCGWTQTQALKMCIASAPASQTQNIQ